MKVCIVGASGKLGQYMVQHALSRGYEVVGGQEGPRLLT
jgi:putative NADH-flavin reductase